jgi:hypothetical protein
MITKEKIMPSTVNSNTLTLEVSQDRSRFWINSKHCCLVRFSLVSGYELYRKDGSMLDFRTGSTTPSQFVAFAEKVNSLYPNNLTDTLVKELIVKCGNHNGC